MVQVDHGRKYCKSITVHLIRSCMLPAVQPQLLLNLQLYVRKPHIKSEFSLYGGSSPRSIKEYQVFPIFFLLLHCVPLYVCRLCINFQELCARLLGMATLRIRFSPSFHTLLIDFLSIRKVIIFSAIATDDRHPLRSRYTKMLQIA